MANLKASKKDVRKTKRRNEQNSQKRARLRTLDKKIHSLVTEGKLEDAKTAFREYATYLDRAGRLNLIHHKQADRRKSRIAALLAAKKPA